MNRILCWSGSFLIGLSLLATTANAQGPAPAAKSATTKKKAPSTKKQAATEIKPDLEPRAVDVLKAASNRLAAAHTLSFTAIETFESPSRHGHPLAYANKFQVVMQRPDKLRVILTGDGPASEFYYDGKIMMAFAPVENLVAVADAPATIDATLEAAYRSAAIYFPFTDVIVTDPYKDLAPGMMLAYYVGQSHVVGGRTTDIVAYAGDGVFSQVWIGTEDKLPYLIHAVYLDDPERLRHNLIFSDWQLDSAIAADAFGSAKAASAKKINFAHPHPEPSPGARPPVRAKSAPKANPSAKTPATKPSN